MSSRWKAGRTAAFAASLAAWCGWGGMEVMGQADAWITSTAASNGSGNWTNMLGAPGSTVALPAPGGALGYNGQAARYSQHIRTNGSGQLIFFEVDGNLYDGDGYLIADARSQTCSECLAPGVMEFVSVPVPGSCDKYYLFSSVPKGTYDYSYVQAAILDMGEDNPRFGNQGSTCNPKKGRLLGMLDGELLDMPQFSEWANSGALAFEPGVVTTTPYVARLPIDQFGKSTSPMLRVVEGSAPGSPSWLFAIMVTKTTVYKITGNGVFRVNPVPTHDHLPTGSTGDVSTFKNYQRDADARLLPNGHVRLVQVDLGGYRAYPNNNASTSYNVLSMDFDPNTGQVVQSGGNYAVRGHQLFYCNAFPSGVTGFAGCALSPDGAGAYIVGRISADCTTSSPWFGYVDLITGAATNLTAALPNVAAYTESRFYRNRAPSGSGEAIYVPRAGGVDAITGIANPASIAVVNGALAGHAPQLQVSPDMAPSSFTPYPRFLDIAVQGDTHLSATNLAACCTYFQTVPGAVVGGHTQLQGMQPSTWNAATNPLQPGSNTLVFNCDLVVESGASLTLNNLTLKFTNGAKVIVKRAGSLTTNNTTFTSITCPGERWPGIRVEGDSNDPTQSQSIQGKITMTSSTVANAQVGLWTARELDISTPVNGYFGGRALVQSTTFRDCINGARITNYHRYLNGAEANYFGNFHNCTFETTADWPGGNPGAHIDIQDVNGVLVTNSRFVNQVPQNWNRWQRGVGIRSYDAAFRCLGYGNANSRFESLTLGVSAHVPDPAEVYRVDGMRFFNNSHGLLDWGSTGGVVTNNRFTTMANMPSLGQTSVGLSLFNAEGYTVERNTFTDQGTSVPSVGIHFLGQSYQNNEVYDNEFNNLNVGCLVEGRHAAYNAPAGESLVPGLQMRCGDHLGNLADQVILWNGWIRHNQGLGENTQKLANNRFLSSVTCDPGNSTAPSVHTYVAAWQPTGLYVNYHYYGHASSPQQRQDCIEDQFGNPLSYTGEVFYDLNRHEQAVEFDKERDCHSGKLDAVSPGGGHMALAGQYTLRQAELASAWQNYRGTMDRMKTGDLVGMIHHQPWHPSHLLRDTLLGNYPLSDSVMINMLKREQPMDAWHLTQVLIQNSPLSPWVWGYVENPNLIPLYFYNQLKQYDQGMGLKQLLEQEIVARQQEAQFTKVLLLDSLANDSTVLNRLQLIDGLLQADSLGDGLRGRYLLALLNGDDAKAAQLAAALTYAKGVEGLLEWGALYQNHNGDWTQSTPADRDELYQMAMSHAPSGGALAWATLYQLAEIDSLPTPELPVMFKSRPRGRNSMDELTAIPVITAMPNPATDRIAFTYGEGLEEGVLEIHDAQGRLMRTIALNGRKGLVESNVRGWADGLYVVRLMLDGYNLGSTKFNVVR